MMCKIFFLINLSHKCDRKEGSKLKELIIKNHKGINVIDSREVAEMIGKKHDNLLRDIRGYIKVIEESSKLRSQDFFIESIYKNSQNKSQPCYLLTKQGCEMVANKMTGEKGILFTAEYVQAFNKMEEHIKLNSNEKVDKLAEMETETKLNNSQTRKANSLMRIHKQCNDPIVKELLFKKAIETLTGKKLITTKKTYSAEEIGKKFNISANKVGRIANANNLKTEQYGELVAAEYNDKAQGSTFRYYDTVIPVIEKLLKE